MKQSIIIATNSNALNRKINDLLIRSKRYNIIKQQSSDLVKWTTANEANNSYFNVQRSATVTNFETLGRVNSKALNGSTNQQLNYSYTDASPQTGHNYYRLEQVDLDGNKSYSEIIDIIWTDRGTVSLYPNPTKDNLNIDFSLNDIKQIEIKLIDMSSRVVKSVLFMSEKGMNHTEVSLSELANGIYNIQLLENNISIYQRKVKKE